MIWNYYQFGWSEEAVQNDLRARYNAVKAYALYLFYDYDAIPDLFEDVTTPEDAESLLLFLLYMGCIYNALYCVQYERENYSSSVLYLIFFGKLFFNTALYLFLTTALTTLAFLRLFFNFLRVFFFFFRYFISIWRPLFKKFGYLINFFKKKKN